MKKPTEITVAHSYFDYTDCKKYIQQKYIYSNRTMHNFWHFVIQCEPHIRNDCYFYMTEDWFDYIKEKAKRNLKLDEIKNPTEEQIKQEIETFISEGKILKHFLDEFGNEEGEIRFHVWW